MHDIIVPARYLAPKWQAYVTPSDLAFRFNDGTQVESLWQLKQALLRLPEDVILHHVSSERNDIAEWVKAVIGDEELATELSKYNHRWGLIVALERQLMRTVNIPEYLAERWLRTVDSSFTFSDGTTASSLHDLQDALGKVDDGTVAFHQERNPNDISVWVSDVIGDYELGELLNEANSRVQMQRFVTDHIEMLRDASED